MDTTLLVLGCSIFVVLGCGHAALLLFSTKFEPQDAELLARLKGSRTSMSKTGNVWRGIQGFHLSHSVGLVVFGSLYIALALENSSYLKQSITMNLGLFIVPIVYAYLAHRFWFSVPRNCFMLAVCFLLASTAFR